MNNLTSHSNTLPLRHINNKELKLNYNSTYICFPIMTNKGALVDIYVKRLHEIIDKSLNQYSKVFSFRIDLRFSNSPDISQKKDTEVITRFIESLKAKIDHNRKLAQRNGNYHNTEVRYIWAKEKSNDGGVHYHVLILLNGNAYRSLGEFDLDNNNLYTRIHDAWASAINIHPTQAIGLVHVGDQTLIEQSQMSHHERINHVFYVGSYLCKAATKVYDDGSKWFGSSRK